MSFPDIPPGKKLPLVDDTTNRLPDPTMDAIAASPELSATYAQSKQNKPTRVLGRGVGVQGDQFFAYGINLGLTNAVAPADYLRFWTEDWSEAWVDANMQRIADLGANLVRITGQYASYAAGPAAFKTKIAYTFEAARRRGLKVTYSFLNVGTANEILGTDTPTINAYKAMIADLVAPYADDPLIYVWDAINDGHYQTDTVHSAIAVALAPYIKTVAPDTLVMASALDSTEVTTAIVNVVDLIGLNWYEHSTMGVSFDLVAPGPLSRLRSLTTKPILITEFGANSGSTGNGPVVRSQLAQAAYVAAVRKLLVRSDIMGICLHKIVDPPVGAGNPFGLYLDDGTPKPAAYEASRFPRERLAAAADFAESMPVRGVVDSFARAASASAVGAPVVGATPVAQKGTFGITAKQLYLAATGGAGANILTWDGRACDAQVETEFAIGGGATKAGLVLRYVDATNFIVIYYGSLGIGDGVYVYTMVAGTATLVASAAGFTGWGGRLTASINDDLLTVQLNGVQLIYTQLAATPAGWTSTLHGVASDPTVDSGTKFRRFSIGVTPRRY